MKTIYTNHINILTYRKEKNQWKTYVDIWKTFLNRGHSEGLLCVGELAFVCRLLLSAQSSSFVIDFLIVLKMQCHLAEQGGLILRHCRSFA